MEICNASRSLCPIVYYVVNMFSYVYYVLVMNAFLSK